jgi:exocyst complex component 2
MGRFSALYADMKEGLLAPSAEFGSKPVRDHLKRALRPPGRIYISDYGSAHRLVGAQKGNQVFLPALENAFKASKLRTTLGVFERSKFFFNLPGFLVESIEAVSPTPEHLVLLGVLLTLFFFVLAHTGKVRCRSP